MLWKCCTQYASKFGKLSSGHRTGKGVFISIPKKGSPKECSNYLTVAVTSHASKVMLKILQARLQQYVNFQMFKLDLEKAEEPEVKLPTSVGSLKKSKEFQKNIFCFIDYAKAFDCVDHNKLWKILQERGMPDHPTCLLRNLYAGQETTVRTGHGTTDWFQLGKEYIKAVYLFIQRLLIQLICRVHHGMPGWMKYKLESRLPGEHRWHHTYGRKQRTKEPPNESERGEWKSWLKTQH